MFDKSERFPGTQATSHWPWRTTGFLNNIWPSFWSHKFISTSLLWEYVIDNSCTFHLPNTGIKTILPVFKKFWIWRLRLLNESITDDVIKKNDVTKYIFICFESIYALCFSISDVKVGRGSFDPPPPAPKNEAQKDHPE